MNVKNLFENIPQNLDQEFFKNIINTGNFRVERIISSGHSSPENFWYDQDTNEFVLLLKGSAELMFENDKTVVLNPGDYLNIPAHVKHRVGKTDQNELTYWLTIHY